MTIEQITRKIRDWSVIRDRALKLVTKYHEERKRYEPHFTAAIISCVEKIDKYERVSVYAEGKLHDYAELLFSETL